MQRYGKKSNPQNISCFFFEKEDKKAAFGSFSPGVSERDVDSTHYYIRKGSLCQFHFVSLYGDCTKAVPKVYD
jgi:hypothetical protein